jgi:tellurite resistance protein TerC
MTLALLAAEAAQVTEKLQRFDVPGWLWIAFIAGVAVALLLDLFVLHRHAHEIAMREATITSAVWITLGLSFSLPVWYLLGGDAAFQYLAGYVVEESLSVDNVFVWAVVFSYFSVPNRYQHRVLFWGIFGALTLRAIFIFAGVALLNRLAWLMYVFGGILVFTAIRVAMHGGEEVHPERNPVLKLLRRFVPVTADYHGQSLFVRIDGRLIATPLFVTLVLVEATDVVFAIDSVPAVLALSRDPFVIFSSNAMAILGLRSLYFMLAGARNTLVHINKGLGVILFYVGVKMIVADWFHIPTTLSLAVIAVVLAVTVIASLHTNAKRRRAQLESPPVAPPPGAHPPQLEQVAQPGEPGKPGEPPRKGA